MVAATLRPPPPPEKTGWAAAAEPRPSSLRILAASEELMLPLETAAWMELSRAAAVGLAAAFMRACS